MTGPILDEWIPITAHELFYLLSLAETPENDEAERAWAWPSALRM